MAPRLPFREHHLLTLLESYEEQDLPLDLFMSKYFRSNRSIGAKDRGIIAQTAYNLVRWRGLLDHLSGPIPTWDERNLIYQSPAFEKAKVNEQIPPHIRVSFPKSLFDLMVMTHGFEKAYELCQISNIPAPTTVRVNTLKTTRDEMLAKWRSEYEVSPCVFSENGIIFQQRINFFGLPEFKAGFFEVQDEGSQLLANLVRAEPGQLVMDYCAGSGGKTLAFAPAMRNSGQIFLHDIRDYALQESRKRLRRAGIQNSQIVQAEDPKLSKLKKKMDWVLVDSPCTGTGTIRRNPDMKWKFSMEMVERLLGQQRMIFEKALSFLKPEGHIVFATCSLLHQENRSQVEHFCKTYSLELVGQPFESLPSIGGMDGFFGAVLKRNLPK